VLVASFPLSMLHSNRDPLAQQPKGMRAVVVNRNQQSSTAFLPDQGFFVYHQRRLRRLELDPILETCLPLQLAFGSGDVAEAGARKFKRAGVGG
jgi:hypothetical protein